MLQLKCRAFTNIVCAMLENYCFWQLASIWLLKLWRSLKWRKTGTRVLVPYIWQNNTPMWITAIFVCSSKMMCILVFSWCLRTHSIFPKTVWQKLWRHADSEMFKNRMLLLNIGLTPGIRMNYEYVNCFSSLTFILDGLSHHRNSPIFALS